MTARSIATLALVVAGLSLAANAFLLLRVRQAEREVAPYRAMLAEMIGDDGTVSTEVRIPAGTPISLDVPIDERVTIRVDTVLPINTRVNVPLRSPLGNYDIRVPIRANVPVRANVPIRLRHTFRLRTSTSTDIVVPLEIRP